MPRNCINALFAEAFHKHEHPAQLHSRCAKHLSSASIPSFLSRMRTIRTAARALIIQDNQLLAIKMKDDSGIFYILPGGGQLHGETLKDGLVRECLEEIGCRIVVANLAYVREYIGRNHDFAEAHRHFHQLETVFHAKLAPNETIRHGSELDRKQIGVTWLRLDELETVRFYPKALRNYIASGQVHGEPRYFGDVN